MARSQEFFEEPQEHSEVKARIVADYLSAWAKVILPRVAKDDGQIAYIDLYAGPGRYKDGSFSTPLMVLKKVISDPKFPNHLVACFNDYDKSNVDELQREIKKLPGVDKLRFTPEVSCDDAGEAAKKYFSKTKAIPSFTFIDPWGYKGLSLEIVRSAIKGWGCECIFFFNYNRINPGISNDIVKRRMESLFGKERARMLRKRVKGLSAAKREAMILEEMEKAIKKMGGKHVLSFRFKNPNDRPMHYVIFVSKDFRGFSIMKDIMAKASSTDDEGVPSFSFSPFDAQTPLLFSLHQPLSALRASLLKNFAGLELSVGQIYEKHSVNWPYIKKNYKNVLLKMEEEGIITVRSLKSGKRPRGTLADHLLVRFPKENGGGDG